MVLLFKNTTLTSLSLSHTHTQTQTQTNSCAVSLFKIPASEALNNSPDDTVLTCRAYWVWTVYLLLIFCLCLQLSEIAVCQV